MAANNKIARGGIAGMVSGLFGRMALFSYALSGAWYAWDIWQVFKAVEKSSPYPFFFKLDTMPVALFSLGGSVYWTTFGLDRSGTPASIAGYVMAGAHIFVFALQVWLGPTMWAMKNLS